MRPVLPWITLGAALLATLAGCGPRYQTFTNYVPPASELGQQCVASCLDARSFCRRESDLEVGQCRVEAKDEADLQTQARISAYYLDLGRFAAGQLEAAPERPAPASPNFGACSARGQERDGRCAQDFDLCYQTCGGRVTYTTHCVANCD